MWYLFLPRCCRASQAALDRWAACSSSARAGCRCPLPVWAPGYAWRRWRRWLGRGRRRGSSGAGRSAQFERTGQDRSRWSGAAAGDRAGLALARLGCRRRADATGRCPSRPSFTGRAAASASRPSSSRCCSAWRSTPRPSSPRSCAPASSRCRAARARPPARWACRARQTMRLVMLPQALRVIIPPLTNQYLNLTKNSSLAVAIGYPDLVSIANTAINQTGRAVECIAIIMAGVPEHLAAHLGADELVQQARRPSRNADDAMTALLFNPIAAAPAAGQHRGPACPGSRANLFGDWQSALTTVVLVGAGCCTCCRRCCNWALFQAVFGADADACQAARGTGACWGVVAEKYRVIIFGRYPFEEQWRPLIATRAAARRCWWPAACAAFWKPWLALLWVAVLARLLRADGRRRARPEPVRHRPLGRPAADPDAGHAVDRPGLPAGGAGGAGPAQPSCRRSAPSARSTSS